MSQPFKIYRNRRGWPSWFQPIIEAFWILTGRWSLHRAWQDRLINNRAIIFELGLREVDKVGIIGSGVSSRSPGNSAGFKP